MSEFNTQSSEAREAILGRVREALQTPTIRPKHPPAADTTNGDTGLSVLSSTETKEWLPHVGDSYADRLELFAERCEKLKTELIQVASPEEAAKALGGLGERENWRRVAYHEAELVDGCISSVAGEKLNVTGGYDPQQLNECDAGITGCDALVAQTGSVVVSGSSAGGRALSVLPPHHVVIATAEQLLADLPDAYALLRERYEGAWPSFLSVISGPSRTGDIERILVLGAHGPKKLTIVLIGQ